MHARFRLVLALVLAGSLSACTGTRPGGSGTPGGSPGGTPDYETFDPAPYDRTPPPPERPAVTVSHDVPPSLLDGSIEEPEVPTTPREPYTVEGFRLQVFSSEDRSAANRTASEVQTWWRANREGAPEGLSDPLDVRVDFIAPYYRVRLGAFETREQAEAALAYVRSRFGDAFPVPATVTIFPAGN